MRFCGYLGKGPTSQPRAYTSTRGSTRGSPIHDDDIVAQVKTTTEDGKSYVWVKRDVTIIQCHSATAVELAQMIDDDVDPGAIYPKH